VSLRLGPATPILRIFDEAKAREFYQDALGFAWDWEHRFAPDLPLFAQVSRAGLRLFLSEHHGDGTPGTKIHITTAGQDGLEAEILGKQYRYARPGIETMPWGERQMRVTDPFGNTLIFAEPTQGSTAGPADVPEKG
jgi:uncharacterized glyoxalase superfamily protein PhnB